MSILDLMLIPFLECLILVGIHSYLGLHVIRRHVIFVDLALAQIAALGATVGFLFGILPGSRWAFVFSLVFCLVGAGIFAFSRMRSNRVPQEAVIGLIYAATAALVVLVVDKTNGVEHLESMLVGSLLWVRWSDVVLTLAVYTVIGGVHYLFRRQMLLISDDPEEAYRRGMYVRLWDFLFYATFGFVITISVRVAGVLLVFTFLVAPAILAVLAARRLRNQLLVGWIAGTLVTTVALYLSYALDMPSGPTVVTFYALVLVAAAVSLHIARTPAGKERWRALAWTGAGLAGLCGFGLLVGQVGSWLGERERKALHEQAERVAHAAEASRKAAEAGAGEQERPAAGVLDPEQELAGIRQALQRREQAALARLVALLASNETPLLYREEAVALLRELAGQDFGFQPEAEPRENEQALAALEAWAAGFRLAGEQPAAGGGGDGGKAGGGRRRPRLASAAIRARCSAIGPPSGLPGRPLRNLRKRGQGPRVPAPAECRGRGCRRCPLRAGRRTVHSTPGFNDGGPRYRFADHGPRMADAGRDSLGS